MVKNYMEIQVSDALKKELRDNAGKYTTLCKCPECLAAVKAGALNRLKPFYITRLKGQVFGEAQSKETQNQGDVLVALVSSINEHIASVPHGGKILIP